MKTMKRILASFLVVAMLVAGIMISPVGVDASETEQIVKTEKNGVIYVSDNTNLKFSNYWTTGNKTVPVRPGFVFGGWYTQDGDNMKAIKESEVKDATSVNACAKFVPAEVLSVRAQIEKAVEDNNGDTKSGRSYVRLLSGVNGLDYQNVGFDIYYNKKHHETNEDATNITKVFSSLKNDESGTEPITADTIFGDAATHFSVLRLADIAKKNYTYVIYVTPQWTTLDGTLVEGQGKYVRIIDGYAQNHYISVPVNFFAGSEVTAGQIEMSYPSSLEVVDFDAGTIMPDMVHNDDKAGTVKIVGNVEKGKTLVEPETGIYANVWFKVKSGETVENTELDFTLNNSSFANWDEKFVTDLQAWNYTYLK